jgi:hypothetical protein
MAAEAGSSAADLSKRAQDADTDPIASQLRDKLLKQGLKLDDGADDFASALFEAMLGSVLSTAPPTRQQKRPRPDADHESSHSAAPPGRQREVAPAEPEKTTILKSADLMRAIAAANPPKHPAPCPRGPQSRLAPQEVPPPATVQPQPYTAHSWLETRIPAKDQSIAGMPTAAASTETVSPICHGVAEKAAAEASSPRQANARIQPPHVAVVAIEQCCVNQRAAAICSQVLDQLADMLRGPATSCSVINITATTAGTSKRAKLAPSTSKTATSESSRAQFEVDAALIGQAMAIASQMPPTAAIGSDFRLVSPGPTTFLARTSAHAWAGALDAATVAKCASVIRQTSQAQLITTGSQTSPPTTVVVFLDTAERHEPPPPASIAAATEARTAHAAADRVVARLPTIVYSLSRALSDVDAARSAASQIASRLLTHRWIVPFSSGETCEADDALDRRQLSKCNPSGGTARHRFFASADNAQRSGHAVAMK